MCYNGVLKHLVIPARLADPLILTQTHHTQQKLRHRNVEVAQNLVAAVTCPHHEVLQGQGHHHLETQDLGQGHIQGHQR